MEYIIVDDEGVEVSRHADYTDAEKELTLLVNSRAAGMGKDHWCACWDAFMIEELRPN